MAISNIRLWVAFALCGGLSCLLFKSGIDFVFVTNNKAFALTFFSVFIAGPLWVAYSRLNSLDVSEGLKPSHAASINNFARFAKRLIVKFLLIGMSIVALIFVSWLISEAYPQLSRYVAPLAIAVSVISAVYIAIASFVLLNKVEVAVTSVTGWRLEQKERTKQAVELRKARVDQKLVPDEKLLGYRDMLISEVDVPPKVDTPGAIGN